jgi:hypothetical protein
MPVDCYHCKSISTRQEEWLTIINKPKRDAIRWHNFNNIFLCFREKKKKEVDKREKYVLKCLEDNEKQSQENYDVLCHQETCRFNTLN